MAASGSLFLLVGSSGSGNTVVLVLPRLEDKAHILRYPRKGRIEQARKTRLSEEIEAWRLAQEVRDDVAALRSSLDGVEGEDRKRITAWCDWAERCSWPGRIVSSLNQ